jgi:PIN domain nuclease of toxin-antitoxin system
LGKLDIPDNLQDVIAENRFEYLPIKADHVFVLNHLPNVHRDPFGRIMIAQASHEGFTFITRDEQILKYDILHMRG